MQIPEMPYLMTVGYARLSKEDGDDESVSIANQKLIIEDYAAQLGLTIDKWYIDDGYTGHIMSRPAFDQLKQDLNDNKIGTIIVKHVSRIGRHSAKVQLFLENIEEAGKRVISITNNYDTLNKASHDTIGIQTWIDEKYIKDTSVSVRAAIGRMQKDGKFINKVPYGYALDPLRKGHYYIDETYAKYVREIFDLYINGRGVQAIAREFTERKVPTGNMAIKQLLERKGQQFKGTANTNWYPPVIYNILKNDFYIGTLTQGRWKRRTINGKQIKLPQKDCYTFENAHEPIIDKHTFQLAQEIMMERSTNKYRGYKITTRKHVFAGKLYCADCGLRMTPTGDDNNVRYVCKSYNNFGTSICTSHAIHERNLKESLIYFLEHCVCNLSNTINTLNINTHKKAEDNSISILQKDLDRAQKEVKILFEQKMREVMKNPEMQEVIDGMYSEMINDKYAQIKVLTAQINELKEDAMSESDIKRSLNTALEIMNNIIHTQQLTVKQVESIISKITVYEDGGIDIYLKGDLHEICSNHVQYKETQKDKVLEHIIDHIKRRPNKAVPHTSWLETRQAGIKISKKKFDIIFATLIEAGYLVSNGHHMGYTAINLQKLVDDYENNNVGNGIPRCKYNNVTMLHINKICAWAKTITPNNKKTLF